MGIEAHLGKCWPCCVWKPPLPTAESLSNTSSFFKVLLQQWLKWLWMNLMSHDYKQKNLSTDRIFPNNTVPSTLVKNITKFSPQFSCYLYFLVLFFPSNPNSALLPRQPSNSLEHNLSLQRTAKGVVEKTTCFTAAWLFCGGTSKYSHSTWIIYADRQTSTQIYSTWLYSLTHRKSLRARQDLSFWEWILPCSSPL